MLVAQVPGFRTAVVHRAVIGFGIADQSGILGGIEITLAIVMAVIEAPLQQQAQHVEHGTFANGITGAQRHAAVIRWLPRPGTQTTVSRSRHPGSFRVDAVQIVDDRANRTMQAVEIQAVKADPRSLGSCLIVLAQPFDECLDVGIAPHPGRKSPERRFGVRRRAGMPHVAVDAGRIRPVGFHCDDPETVGFDQMAGDRSPRAIELGRAVAGFAEQDHARMRETIESAPKIGSVAFLQRFGLGTDRVGDRIHRRPCIVITPSRVSMPGHFFVPAVSTDQGHEQHVAQILLVETVLARAGQLDQPLAMGNVADRHHQPATDLQLTLQNLGNARPAGGCDDRVEWSDLRPACSAIAELEFDVVQAEALIALKRELHELRQAFDRIDAFGDGRHHRRCIARTCPNLEHPLPGKKFGSLDHERHDIRLRDGLARFDRQRRVFIGELPQCLRHKGLARDPAHGLEHASIPHTARGKLQLDHLLALRSEDVHQPTLAQAASRNLEVVPGLRMRSSRTTR
jgi:hypothetical protein